MNNTQNEASRITTGCHKISNIDHLHAEADILKVRERSELLSAVHSNWIDVWNQRISETLFTRHRGSNDSRLHVVEPPRGRSFIWQIGVNSSIQDRRQVDRFFFYGVESVVRGNADSLLN